jgi:P-type Ca2+ transporter type 2C
MSSGTARSNDGTDGVRREGEGRAERIDRPWATEADRVLRSLAVDPARGLDGNDVRRRRDRYGANILRAAARESLWRLLARQFTNIIVALLVAAALISVAFGERAEAMAVVLVIAINATIGFVTELRAVRSMEALRRLGRVTARVRRETRVCEVHAGDLVPGDIVLIEGGDVVTADLRLIELSRLEADESMLTGESIPVAKQVERVAGESEVHDRRNMLFKGTAVTSGSAEAVVVATGMATELGRISRLVEQARGDRTPLEHRLDALGYRLVWMTVVVALLVVAAGIATGKDALLMVQTGIALAVATIPEGLPIVATLALARGMWRMARRNVLVNRLSAVETLGATTVICTDKTGTLTENHMAVRRIALSGGDVIDVDAASANGTFARDGEPVDPIAREDLREALEIGLLCSNASLDGSGPGGQLRVIGDPTEAALLSAAHLAGLSREGLLRELPEVREEAFDPRTKMMATVHELDGAYRVAVKGAPEAVLAVCTRVRTRSGECEMTPAEERRWIDHTERMAGEGLRVLGLATKRSPSADGNPYEKLALVGIVGLLDPPRPEVKAAIRACREAGVRVIMVTGDQPLTARAIAEAVGLVAGREVEVVRGAEVRPVATLSPVERDALLGADVFARMTPEQKLDLVELHQGAGNVVAMTGDGVNDAPALKKADIGVAMGRRGTQVAREAADMVLRDDAFSSIVAAIGEGRVIFHNIRVFVFYLLSCNVSEVLVLALASLVNAPLPIRPLQILFLNLVTDVFPALALGVGEGRSDVLRRPPRDPAEPILGRRHWTAIGVYGALITLAVLAVFGGAVRWLHLSETRAVTAAFLTLAFAQLWHVFNMRSRRSPRLRNEITRNPFVWAALLVCSVLLLAAVYVPELAQVLGVTPPGAREWAAILGMSFLPLAAGEVLKTSWRRAR